MGTLHRMAPDEPEYLDQFRKDGPSEDPQEHEEKRLRKKMRTKIDEHEAKLIAEHLKAIVEHYDRVVEEKGSGAYPSKAGVMDATAIAARGLLKNIFDVEVGK